MAATPKHSVSVAGIVVSDDDRVLVIRRDDNGHWEAPGGVLELGESFEDGVRREVLEETGLAISVDIFERREYAPAAAADFTGNDTMGRINGWVSGEFDFEALRVSDGKDLYSRHVDVSKLQELEPAYSEFVQHLIRAE